MEAPCLWRPPPVYLPLLKYHWRTWPCPFKCGSILPSAVELGDHIRLKHLPDASDEHLNTVLARGEISVSKDVTRECPLCRQDVSGLESYIKHVGRHLEQLALHALPKIGDEELEDDDDSGEQTDEASELGAISANDDFSETSSKVHEQLEINETNNQVESGGPNTMTVGHDGEGGVNASEVPDGHTPMPPATSSIAYGQSGIEPAEIRKLAPEEDFTTSKLEQGEFDRAAIDESLDAIRKSVHGGNKEKPGESVKNVEQASIGFKELEQLPSDPSNEAGLATQGSRPLYTRFARKYISLETLREFNVDFDFDTDPEYVLVKRWVPEAEQDRMWNHTRLIREKRAESLLVLGFCETHKLGSELLHDWGSRHPKAPPPLPSVGDRQRINIGAINCKKGTPPSPSPPLLPFNGPDMTYRYINHGKSLVPTFNHLLTLAATSSNPPKDRSLFEPVTYYWQC
ncbi:hypothetical protein FPRO05_05627 [Fusarium proliferatum]|uniref:C2H2-type domain-containing protein n=1 Tax=Gibberella intermedia TaxID=948311 RepID=A0A365MMB4_GIBIN|nr:hypothetical protein FPRO05_05627 [Fusarium proliferatum]